MRQGRRQVQGETVAKVGSSFVSPHFHVLAATAASPARGARINMLRPVWQCGNRKQVAACQPPAVGVLSEGQPSPDKDPLDKPIGADHGHDQRRNAWDELY